MNVLEMNNISKSFPGVKALNKVNLSVKPGTVHVLMGENGAGKSTLMKCLFGMYSIDEGNVKIEGMDVKLMDVRDGMEHGIAMIHQELQPIRMMSIAENIFLGRYPLKRSGLIDHDRMYKESNLLLKEVGLDIDSRTLMDKLTVSQMQSVEIAKAISQNAKIIIMDEPTSSLTNREVDTLFEIIDKLKKQNIAIIYISHKIDEILTISDEITILRDGQYVGTWPASEMDNNSIITHMVGRKLKGLFPPKTNKVSDEVVLRVENLTSPNPLSFKECYFEVKKGEVLGVGGLVGAQRTELMEAIYGMRDVQQGLIKVHGEQVLIKRPQDAIDLGLALVTEDRRTNGIFGVLSVKDNVVISSLDNYMNYGLIDRKKTEKITEESIKSLNIRTPNQDAKIQNLSGGNQQKVILARWLANNPEILILDEPTRGIDVGAKYEIYEIINRLAEEGKSIIMISSEMPELLGVSDRIMVMCEGRVSGFLDGKTATQESVMDLATKFMYE